MPAKRQSADDMSDAKKLEHFDRICELGGYADERRKEMEEAKEVAKDAKELWEQAVFQLQQAIRRANDPQAELEFGEDDE